MPGSRGVLAPIGAWGYNTPRTRATAQASRRVRLLELDRFRRGLGAWL